MENDNFATAAVITLLTKIPGRDLVKAMTSILGKESMLKIIKEVENDE